MSSSSVSTKLSDEGVFGEAEFRFVGSVTSGLGFAEFFGEKLMRINFEIIVFKNFLELTFNIFRTFSKKKK